MYDQKHKYFQEKNILSFPHFEPQCDSNYFSHLASAV